MIWQPLGTVVPGEEWQYIDKPLSSRLLLVSYAGDAEWLKKYQPRLYFRIRFSTGASVAKWITLWPKDGEQEVVLLVPVPIALNYLDIRKRRDFESLQANYSVTIEEYIGPPYEITDGAQPFSISGVPYTINGVPYFLIV
ncbi:MAG: hypothetical protein AAFY54_01865 [Cyanobacteria bacterium J06648_10]